MSAVPADAPPLRRIQWSPAWRIVPTRYPSVFLFDRIADPDDFEALYALEAMTNERLRDETGVIELVPKSQRIFGPGSGPIMAAFTHLNPTGSRFSDGSYGVFYAAHERATAIAETSFHHGRFLAATREAPMHLPMRLYRVDVDARLHDLRRRPAPIDAAIHDADNHSAAQSLGRGLRDAGSAGVVYRSVRHSAGQCVGLFTPKAARNCVHAAYLLYAWDGERFAGVYERLEDPVHAEPPVPDGPAEGPGGLAGQRSAGAAAREDVGTAARQDVGTAGRQESGTVGRQGAAVRGRSDRGPAVED